MQKHMQQHGWLMGLAILAMSNMTLAASLTPTKEPHISSSLQAQVDSRQAEAHQLLQQGMEQFQQSNFREALQSWEQALEIYREVSDRQGEIYTLGNLGLVYVFLGQYEQAIDMNHQSLAMAREIGDRRSENSSLLSLGNAYFSLGKYEQATDYYQQTLALAREIGNPQAEANALGSLGLILAFVGQYEQAIDYYQQVLVLASEIDDFYVKAISLGNLGDTYYLLGEYQNAIESHLQSLEINREIGDREREAASLSTLGNIYFDLGQHELAIDLHGQSLTLAREIGNLRGEALSLGNLGNAYLVLKQYEQAIDYYEQNLALSREIGDRAGEGHALGNLGSTYRELEQYEQAISFQEQSLMIANEIGDRRSEATSLGNLGNIYSSVGQYRQAIEAYQQAISITREIGDRQGEVNSLNNLGAIYLEQQELTQAESVLVEAVDIADALRAAGLNDADKVSLFETQQGTFRLLQQTLVSQGKYELALAISERGRAQAFAELLAQQLTTENIIVNVELSKIETIKTFVQRQKTTLVEYSLVNFRQFEPVLQIWVISPDGSIIFRQQFLDDANLDNLVLDSRQAIGARGDRASAPPQLRPDVLAQLQAEQDEKLNQLHDLLIDPIADLLPDDPNQPVVFIPQGELFLVPFPALKDDNGDYLIENHTILTAPSIQVLQLTHNIANSREGTTTDQPVIVGNPTMPTVTFLTDEGEFVDTQLSSLSGALKEANAVSEFLGASALTGDRATEVAVKQQLASADLIHLATHGLLEYGDPRETGTRDVPGAIALTPGSGEDGLLTSAEILQMDLQADLVVLSACDTGRGRITGDGVIGLSRSFIAAGVPSVIVSLWAVPDAPTAELMTEFYRQLDQGQSKAQALRQAMLITMQTHPDPKDWAAFTLIGESE